VFADAKDTAELAYIDDTIGWIVAGTAGIPAPPVISEPRTTNKELHS